jgi:heat shock protein 4
LLRSHCTYFLSNFRTIISFGEKARHIGEAGLSQMTFNAENTVPLIKRLIGMKYSQIPKDELVQFPCKIVQGVNDTILIEVLYREEIVHFNPVQILAMMLTQLGKYVEAEGISVKNSDTVIAIPVHFLDVQRRAVLQAARIAGYNVVKLVNDVCAAAVEYGIYKELPENQVFNVAFVDVGHANTTVSIVELKHDQVKVLANAFDSNLGAREFEQILIDHFIEEIKSKYNLIVRPGTKPYMRLQKETEKLKKVLSVNPVVQLRIECFMEDKDINFQITRDQFEEMTKSLHHRFEIPVRQALADSKVNLKDISSVEVFGGASYIPALRQIISDVFQQPTKTTLNATETVAKGSAIIAGMLSTTMHLAKKFTVVDAIQFPINLGWVPTKNNEAMDVDTGDTIPHEQIKHSLIFKKFDPTPNTKLLTFKKSSDFDLFLAYAESEALPRGSDVLLGHYTVTNIPKRDEPVTVKVTVRHDTHGIASVVSAQMVEEVEVEEKEEIKEEPKKVEEPKKPEEQQQPPTQEQAPQQQPTEVKTEAPAPQAEEKKYRIVKKKRIMKTDLPIISRVPQFSEQEIAEFIQQEERMILIDREIAATEEARNAVEAYIYSMKEKIFDEDTLGKYVDESTRDHFDQVLSEAEAWLYGEGAEATKEQSQKKLQELKKFGDPIENRKREAEERVVVLNNLLSTIQEYENFINSTDEKYAHIGQEDRQKVADKIAEIRNWLSIEMDKQSKLKDYQDPTLTVYNLNLKLNELRGFVRPIMNKPKPAPAKEETKKTEEANKPADEQQQPQGNEEKRKAEKEQKPADKMETEE